MTDAPSSPHPRATLVALTPEAQRALGGAGELRVTRESFNVERESRSSPAGEPLPADEPERRSGAVRSCNDAYVQEESSGSLHISREHCAIERIEGLFFLVDCGSACGTIVAGGRVGGNRRGGRTELRDGDEVIVGTAKSPYIFRFRIAPAEP